MAEYLAAGMNSNCWGGDHAAIHVEDRVVRWLAEILGLPASAEGILTSGGSMANFTALAAARRAMSPDVRETGFAGTPPLVVYASDEVHNCVDKAVDLLGIGRRQLRILPTDDRFRLRTGDVKKAIASDRRAGLRPAIVVGNAGSVNTGAIDPLEELADLCAQEELWFHVDGAYGAMACVSEGAPTALRQASSGPTRWRPIRTSGSTCPTRPAPPSCASRGAWRRVPSARRLPGP